MIKLIAIDLDGTLLNKHKIISKNNKNALINAANKHVQIVCATGRPYNAIIKDFFTLPNTKYIISSNGSIIWDEENKQYIKCSYLSKKQATLILKTIGNLKNKLIWEEICVDGKSYAPFYQFKNISQYSKDNIFTNYLQTTRTPINDIIKFSMICKNSIERISCFSSNTKYLLELENKIKNIKNINITKSSENDIEIGNITASKGLALKYLAEYINLNPNEIMAIGNGINDIDMIQYAKYGVAVENSHPLLINTANYITASNEKDGVAKAIKQFIT